MSTKNVEVFIKILTVILLILLVAASIFNKKISFQGISKDNAIKLIEANINYQDKEYIDSLTKKVRSEIGVNEKALLAHQKTLNLADDKLKSFEGIIDEKNDEFLNFHTKHLNALKENKNEIVFEFERNKATNKTNIWLIILIILTAGIVGGWARVNYSLLLPLANDLQDLIAKMKGIKDEIDKTKSDDGQRPAAAIFNRAANQVRQKTDDFEQKIDNILNELPTKKQRVNTSIVFGVIASSITLLALKLTDSAVLKFNENIDYFILWAWCLLGAVYAKDSIERIYNRNFAPGGGDS